jgi:enoyl-CoA hydratase/carnithine racemase
MSETDTDSVKLIDIEYRETFAIMRLNRPEKRNAVNRKMRTEMLAALEELRGKRNVVLLTGTDKSFCAGIDLKERKIEKDQGIPPDPKSDWNEVNIAIRRHPAIFIAAVNGIALGGGSTLINVCDLAITAEDAQIGMPEMGFATYPALAGPAAQLTISRKRAAYMILTAKRIDGKTAVEWGMVNKAVPLVQLMEEAEKLAAHVGQFDAAALTESKRALDQIPNVVSEWRQVFEYGAKANTQIRALSSAQSEGLARFSSGERNPEQGS